MAPGALARAGREVSGGTPLRGGRATVPGRFFRALFVASTHAGVETGAVEAALFPQGLEDDARYSWALYCETAERLVAVIGSDARAVDVFGGWASAFPELSAAVAHIADPFDLAQLVTHGFAGGETQPLRTTLTPLPGRRFVYAHEVEDGFAGCRGGAVVTAGLLAGQPCLIGLPRADVALELIADRRARIVVTLPPARALAGGNVSPSDGGRSAWKLFAGIRAQADNHRLAAQRLRALAARLAPPFAEESAREMGDRWLITLRDTLDASFALLWSHAGPTSRLLASQGVRDGEARVLSLDIGTRSVGALELPAAVDTFALEPILPLLAVALARRLAAPARWGLSPTEARVCDRLVAGEDNRTIARALGLSTETVADHVGAVLAKSGASRRTEVVAAWRAHASATAPATERP